MKPQSSRTKKRASTIVPPLAVSVDEALTRLLKVKPPAKRKAKAGKNG